MVSYQRGYRRILREGFSFHGDVSIIDKPSDFAILFDNNGSERDKHSGGTSASHDWGHSNSSPFTLSSYQN